jgi:tetratricopeptide (TPR) repeat protein
VGQPQEVHIRKLQEFYWSDADPDGRGFVPLADALRKVGDLREAHRVLREGLQRHPDFPSGHIVAAWLGIDRGELHETETHFRLALELDRHNIFALRGLAEILLDRGETAAALELLEALLREDPIDQDLPDRVHALREQLEAPDVEEPDPGAQGLASVWDDPDVVAEEVSWETAALQADSSWNGSPGGPEGIVASAMVVEDAEPIPSPDDLDEALVTSTLGEIYLRQGFLDRAQRVFETLVEKDPGNEHLEHRLEEVRRRRLSAELPSGERVATDGERPLEDGIVPIAWLAPDHAQDLPLEEEGSVEIVPIESLAPDRVGPRFLTETAPVEPIPIDLLAPDEVVSIDLLAPDEVVSIDLLAPDEVVSIDLLAPDEVVSIDLLAPDEVVSIDLLAPDEPISIDILAPDEPEGRAGGVEQDEADSGRDPTIDAFEKWLDNLQ